MPNHRPARGGQWLFLLAGLGGCAPLSPSLPVHLMETTEVLKRGKVSLGFAGGAGGLAQEGFGTGGALRARVGVGARQELGIEGAVVYADSHDQRGTGPAWLGRSTAFGARLSWKAAPLPWLGLLAGVAASTSATGAAAGGDLGVLFSSERALAGRLRPYVGARAFIAVPAGRDSDEAGGVTLSLAVPAGLSIQVGQSVRLFFEGGGLGGWSSLGGVAEVPAPSRPLRYEQTAHGGGYGAFGAVFILERNKDSTWLLESLQRFR